MGPRSLRTSAHSRKNVPAAKSLLLYLSTKEAIAAVKNAIAEVHKSFYRELRAVAQMRGYKDGWVGYKFKDRYGTFPPREYSHLPPMAPSDATFRWVKSRSIAWAKSRNNPANEAVA